MKITHALVVKLVDTKDLKSLPFGSASSSLAEGTTNMSYPLIISDINKRSERIKSLLKKLNKLKIKNLIIVIGGDGFMLKTLKK